MLMSEVDVGMLGGGGDCVSISRGRFVVRVLIELSRRSDCVFDSDDIKKKFQVNRCEEGNIISLLSVSHVPSKDRQPPDRAASSPQHLGPSPRQTREASPASERIGAAPRRHATRCSCCSQLAQITGAPHSYLGCLLFFAQATGLLRMAVQFAGGEGCLLLSLGLT